jgi:hypothetical protein
MIKLEKEQKSETQKESMSSKCLSRFQNPTPTHLLLLLLQTQSSFLFVIKGNHTQQKQKPNSKNIPKSNKKVAISFSL